MEIGEVERYIDKQNIPQNFFNYISHKSVFVRSCLDLCVCVCMWPCIGKLDILPKYSRVEIELFLIVCCKIWIWYVFCLTNSFLLLMIRIPDTRKSMKLPVLNANCESSINLLWNRSVRSRSGIFGVILFQICKC